MKKIISVLLASALLFAMFALCVSADGATNVALDATVTVAQPGAKPYKAVLNDGAAANVFDTGVPLDWFSFFTADTADANVDSNNVGNVVLDLASATAVSQVRVHFYNPTAEDGNLAAPLSAKVYFSADGSTYDAGTALPLSDAEGAYWATLEVADVTAKSVKIEVACEQVDDPDYLYYTMLNEIEIYTGGTASEESKPSTDSSKPSSGVLVEGLISNGSTVTTTNSAGESIEGARTYKGKLTDGTFDVAEGAAEWFGFFRNSGTPDQNVADGIGYITIDLGKEYDLTKVRVFVPADDNTAPGAVTAAISADGTTYGEAAALSATSESTANGKWMSVATEGTGRYVKLQVTVGDGEWQYWALLSEVQVYGMTDAPQNTPSAGDASNMLGFAILAVIAITGSAVVIKTRR